MTFKTGHSIFVRMRKWSKLRRSSYCTRPLYMHGKASCTTLKDGISRPEYASYVESKNCKKMVGTAKRYSWGKKTIPDLGVEAKDEINMLFSSQLRMKA